MHSAADENDPPLLAKAQGKQRTSAHINTRRGVHSGVPRRRPAGLRASCAARRPVRRSNSHIVGISTIYMAAAVRDRGAGGVITTELLQSKADRAREYIREAGLLNIIDLRVGNTSRH